MYSLSLESDRSGWLGTFGVAVTAIARDILSDGAPLEGVVVDIEEADSVSGVLTEADDSSVTVNGVRIAVENIRGFHVS